MHDFEQQALAGDWAGLVETFDAVVDEQVSDWRSVFWRAFAAFKTDDYVTAFELGRQVFDAQPEVLEIAEFMAVMSVLLGQSKEAYFYLKIKNATISDERLARVFETEPLPDAGLLLTKIEENPLLTKALLFLGAGELEEAKHWFLQQLRMKPNDVQAHISYVHCLMEGERFRSALDALRSAVASIPQNADLYLMMARVLTRLGKREQAKSAYRMATSFATKKAALDGMYCASFFTDMEENVEGRVQRCIAWGEAHGLKERPSPIPVQEAGERSKLLIGFILTDVDDARVMPALAKFFSHKDEEAFKYVGYGQGEITSLRYQALQGSFDDWRDLDGVVPATLRNMIAADGVDILVNLSGFRDPAYLSAFGTRMAPVQIAWLESPYGTGLKNTDYVFSDQLLQNFPEKVISLEQSCSFVARRPYQGTPMTREDTRPTFVADATFEQLTPHTLEVWARVLLQFPDTVLVLRDHDFFASDNAADLIERFGNYGVAHRIDVLSVADRRDFFQHGDVVLLPVGDPKLEVVLDALEVGVPCVSCAPFDASPTPLKKIFELLNCQDELSSENFDDYAAKISHFLGDESHRKDFSARISAELENSPYFDYQKRMKAFEATLQEIWEEKTKA